MVKLLIDYLNNKSKKDLINIITNHYKFLVSELEKAKKQYDGFLKENMNICAEHAKDEYNFILLQLKWYENYILSKIQKDQIC